MFFSRQLNTGDIAGDISLAGRCLYVLWAWGATITRSGSVSQHTSRGTHGVICFPDIGECPGIIIYNIALNLMHEERILSM